MQRTASYLPEPRGKGYRHWDLREGRSYRFLPGPRLDYYWYEICHATATAQSWNPFCRAPTSGKEDLINQSSAFFPKVSVVSITYNHEAFIRDALDGFVAQNTNFPVEIIVADDASTDSTPEIVQEYVQRYPDLFKSILRSKNVGGDANFMEALSLASGQYIALCEGDDYWIDPQKLQKQVAFLDRNPGVAICFHPVRVTTVDGCTDDTEFPPVERRNDLSLDALISYNFIQTNSVVYRRQDWYGNKPTGIAPGDHYLHIRHAMAGGIAMLPETMAVYRRHSGGMWSDAQADRAKFWSKMGSKHAAFYEAVLELFPGDPHKRWLVCRAADEVLRDMFNSLETTERFVLLNVIAAHPLFAELALEYRWSIT